MHVSNHPHQSDATTMRGSPWASQRTSASGSLSSWTTTSPEPARTLPPPFTRQEGGPGLDRFPFGWSCLRHQVGKVYSHQLRAPTKENQYPLHPLGVRVPAGHLCRSWFPSSMHLRAVLKPQSSILIVAEQGEVNVVKSRGPRDAQGYSFERFHAVMLPTSWEE